MEKDGDQLIKQAAEVFWDYAFLMSETFTAFLDLIPEAAILSNEAGEVILTNTTACRVFQYSRVQFLQVSIEDLVPATIKPTHANLRKWFFENPQPRYLESRNLDLSAVKSDGSEFPMESSLFAIHTDKGPIAVNLIRDISSQKEAQRKMSEYAFVDALTNLPNRRYFDENFKRNVAKAKRHQHNIGLLYIDLDKFKPINDEFGHEYGDQVLKCIASRLSATVRDEDFVARIGGDEFVVMVYPATTTKNLAEFAKRIVAVCAEPINVNQETFCISASVGITLNEQHDDHQFLLQQADKAMYKAKQFGGNRHSH